MDKFSKNVSKKLRIIANIEDVPLFSIDVKILKFWSLLIENNYRQYFAYLPYMLLNILQIMGLYHSEETAHIFIRNSYVAILIFNTHFRAMLLNMKRQRFNEFLKYLRVLYEELMLSQDLDIKVILKDYTDLGRKLSKINLIMGSLTCLGFSISPLVAKERGKYLEVIKIKIKQNFIIYLLSEMVFDVYIPYIDKYATPWYEIFLICQVIMIPSGMCMFIPFTSLLVSLILFSIIMCKVLQFKLRTLSKDLPKEETREEIIKCIKYQLKMIR